MRLNFFLIVVVRTIAVVWGSHIWLSKMSPPKNRNSVFPCGNAGPLRQLDFPSSSSFPPSLLAEAQIKTANFFFWTLEKADPEGWEKAWNPSGKEACVNSHQRRRNNFFFFFKYITLETAAPENRETATHHSGKGACVYATYRDRSVCAVAYNSRCITGSSCFRFLFALRCCLPFFYSENFVSCVCRVLDIDEGTEISDRKDMQSALSSTHHLL